MSNVHRARGRSVSASELESLGKTAARLSDTSGLSLTEAAIRTLEHESLNAEQIRRAVEQTNINAVNMKFASLRGDRIVHIDGGPADPVAVIDALNASASAPGAAIHALEYSAAPSYEKQALAFDSFVDPDLPRLESKLAGAHNELIDMCAGIEFRMEMALDELRDRAKFAHNEGASLSDLVFAWSQRNPAMAKVAASQLRTEIPWGEKRAGARIAPGHRVMVAFEQFAKVATEYHTAVEARRNVEAELARVQGFRVQHVC